MRELDIIRSLWQNAKRSPFQKNGLMTSDSEILDLGGRLIALTTDEFSQEDGFPENNPYDVGWNVVTATLSDLLAVGAEPRFLIQVLVTTGGENDDFFRGLARGVSAALENHGAFLAGGDLGKGPTWRYTGVGLGEFSGRAPLSRLISGESGDIVVTGNLGDGNAAALLGTPRLMFECRLQESRWLAEHALACMDTSDGLISAMTTISGLNPQYDLVLDLESVPLAPLAIAAAGEMQIPLSAFLIGSAGEYELLAVLPKGIEVPKELDIHSIGRCERGRTPGMRLSARGRTVLVKMDDLPDPRALTDRESYAKAVLALARRLSLD